MNNTENTTSVLQPQGPDPALILAVSKAAFGTSIYLIFSAFITTVGNSLLLLLFLKSPDRWFCQSSTYFLAPVAFSNLITGLVAEPMQAACFMMLYLQDPNLMACRTLSVVWPLIHLVSMNISLFSVWAFTVAQYLAVVSPLKLASRITTRRVILCEVLICIYVAVFQLSYHMGVPYEIFYQIDMYFNTIFMLVVTIFLYVRLHRTFLRKMKRGLMLRTVKTSRQVEKQFVVVNGFLIGLYIVCILPTACSWFATLYWPHLDGKPEIHIAGFITDCILYIKFMLDPFVFAWRLPKYRQALKSIFWSNRRLTSPQRSRKLTATTALSQKEIAILSGPKSPSSPGSSPKDMEQVPDPPLPRKNGMTSCAPTKSWNYPTFSFALRCKPNKPPYRRQLTTSCSEVEDAENGVKDCASVSPNMEISVGNTATFHSDDVAALFSDLTAVQTAQTQKETEGSKHVPLIGYSDDISRKKNEGESDIQDDSLELCQLLSNTRESEV